MKNGSTAKFTIAAVSLALLSPCFALAQSSSDGAVNTRATGNSSMTGSSLKMGENEAMKMVPARAALKEKLDANKMRPGEQFKVQLADTVHLKDGMALPHGTTLWGVVATDNVQQGKSKLALDFTKAELKDGKVIPIKATIVGVVAPEAQNNEGYNVMAGDQMPNSWNAKTLQVDQINALSGVDLHSRIAGNNSGVFVTTKKDDVKLADGSELLLAIAPQGA